MKQMVNHIWNGYNIIISQSQYNNTLQLQEFMTKTTLTNSSFSFRFNIVTFILLCFFLSVMQAQIQSQIGLVNYRVQIYSDTATCMKNCEQCENPYTCTTCVKQYNCCSPLCSICMNQTICYECYQGYILNQDTNICIYNNSCNLSACSKCQQNRCTQCKQGYYINTYQDVCGICSLYCAKCVDSKNCISCKEGNFLKDQKCYKCSQNCNECTNATQCTKCKSSFFINENKLCEKCINQCIQCQDNSSCKTCKQKFYYNETIAKCEQCLLPCEQCLNKIYCVTCHQSYYLDKVTHTCESCQMYFLNCMSCNESTSFLTNSLTANEPICVKCIDGYFLSADKNSCIACSQHCQQCKDQSECTKCTTLYYLDEQHNCKQCLIGNCIICKSRSVCAVCLSGYYWRINPQANLGQCRKCGNQCSDCDQNGCKQCSRGFYQNEQQHCIKCDTECKQCQQQSWRCLSCAPGYFLNFPYSRCFKCLDSCVQCTSLQVCSRCYEGFYLKDKNCQKCQIQGCLTCQHQNKISEIGVEQEVVTCKKCINGFFNQNNTCYTCPALCSICDNTTTCKACLKSAYMSEDGTCKQCTANCRVCKNQTVYGQKCEDCQYGYFQIHSVSGFRCIACQQNCQYCQSSQFCLNCAQGYFRGPNSLQCIKCKLPCKLCESQTQCLTCQQQYYLDGEKCQPCEEGCQQCGKNKCLLCETGYVLNQKTAKCVKCKTQACAKCTYDNLSTCSLCFYGFQLDNSERHKDRRHSTCFICGQNQTTGCKTCESSRQCTTCIKGYQLSNKKCEIKNSRGSWAIVSVCLVVIVVICVVAIIILTIKLKKRTKNYQSAIRRTQTSLQQSRPIQNSGRAVINNTITENQFDNQRSLIDNQLL